MKKTRLPGLYTWSRYQADRAIDFNGFFWAHPDGGLFIDPMPLEIHELEQVTELGGARWVLVSNADHLREALELKERYGATLLAPAADRERFGDAAAHVDEWYDADTALPLSIEAHWIDGGKSPSEPFFHMKEWNALLFSDVVRSHVSGELMLLSDPKLSDKALVLQSLKQLEGFRPDAILLGDGDSLFRGASEELARFFGTLAS